ncbi:MAG: MerR family transcriptional regulator [Berryella intestinalis]|uniref:MerR family transcriptional regulator n=1 Tax=Berryella intestinalis TaxID=1531429 RepID=UPI002A75119A|nr:MerR family transcriptional regulator [Berryella intestinalis]MDY3129319.1 MerR family transcriptional regulator [Berryella intestinalis]
MRISEAARAASVSPRSLRYYEEQGLVVPVRTREGYRDYSPDDVGRAKAVGVLISAGMGTRAIRSIAPCLSWSGTVTALCPKSAKAVESEIARIDTSIRELESAREMLRDMLGRIKPSH